MGDLDINDLQRALLKSGVASRHVRRFVAELNDHVDDLRREAAAHGHSAAAARELALSRIGKPRALVRSVLQQPELRSRLCRVPGVTWLYYPLASMLLAPAGQASRGASTASLVVRWGAALLLSATVTAAMLLAMQLSIAFG